MQCTRFFGTVAPLAVVPAIDARPPRELADFRASSSTVPVGVAPFARDSGLLKGRRGPAGARYARCSTWRTLVAIRHNPTLRIFYDRRVDAGKAEKLALTAAAFSLPRPGPGSWICRVLRAIVEHVARPEPIAQRSRTPQGSRDLVAVERQIRSERRRVCQIAWGTSMPKNIVICCDGTGNQVEKNLSSVLKLFRVVQKNEDQRVYYDPGVGTLGQEDPWAKVRQNTRAVWGLATGHGLDDDVLEACRFLIEQYEEGDRIYLFGFSRGAYTVRVLAGFLHMVGLLAPEQRNLCGYALTAYKQASDVSDFTIAWRFQRVTSGRRVPIKFIGVWDTVSSVLVPRSDRLYVPSMRTLPYTRTNPSVEVFRHAVAIDERRRMFRLNRWADPQDFVANPFDKSKPAVPQDIKQVWFAGVHGDIGGGYPEAESGLSKFPLAWMLTEASRYGLQVNTAQVNHLVRGAERQGSRHEYAAPDHAAKMHNSMTAGWLLLEWIPKRSKWKNGPESASRWYIPNSEPRVIPEGALVHESVLDRQKAVSQYEPKNLPTHFEIEN